LISRSINPHSQSETQDMYHITDVFSNTCYDNIFNVVKDILCDVKSMFESQTHIASFCIMLRVYLPARSLRSIVCVYVLCFCVLRFL